MVKTKELIICIISIVALVLAITTNVFATEGTPDLNSLLGNTNTNTNSDDGFSEIPSTTTPNNTVQNNTVQNNTVPNNTVQNNTVSNNTTPNNTTNNNTTNTMPDTGVSYSSLVIIAIAGVSAVYAYKKIKEYNV